MTVNLNDNVKVKLTETGKEIYRDAYFNLNRTLGKLVFTAEEAEPKVDDEGYTTFQLWDFMNLFGSHIGICASNVIEPLDIVILPRT